LAAAENSAPYFDGDVRAVLSVPSFYENFDLELSVIKNTEIKTQLLNAMRSLL
jgi:hypothetical protein